MAFLIPVIPKPKLYRDPSLPEFNYKELSVTREILGQGSFGLAYRTEYKGEDVVVKELICKEWSESGKKFLKEAKILKECHSKYIVKLHSVCYKPLALMLEYVIFDFKSFGGSQKLSSLDEFLEFCNGFDFKTLELWQLKIASDVSHGLAYLHRQGIVCRDLKVDNVLVSNQHYIDITDDKLKKVEIRNNPIICKLTDFGEARSQINQTKTLLATKTNNVNKGTVAYMAPEIVSTRRQIKNANQLDLERIDVWALGLLFQCVISPDGRPFTIELLKCDSHDTIRDYIQEMYEHHKKPEMSDKYVNNRLTLWSILFIVCELCTSFQPFLRPSANQVSQFLERGHGNCVQLTLSQASARIFNPYTVGSIFNARKYHFLMVGSIFDGRKHLKLRILTNQGKIEKNIKSLNQTTSRA